MPTKIRLQRKGKKGNPFYHIVIADGRAPRDGRLVEKIGSYDPMTNPATIELNFEKALHWVQVGAQPTDTTRAILSYKGVLYKSHLLNGVKKGALTEQKAEVLFKEWLEAKEAKIANKAKGLEEASREAKKKRLAAEAEINEARKAELSKRKAEAQAALEAELAAKAAEESGDKTEEKVENESVEIPTIKKLCRVLSLSRESMKPLNLFVAPILLSCLLVTGCGDPQRSKLVGTWEIEQSESLVRRLDDNSSDAELGPEAIPSAPKMQLQFFRNGNLQTTTMIGIVAPTPKQGRWKMLSFDEQSGNMKVKCTIGLQETEHEIEFIDADTIKLVPPNLAGLSLKLRFRKKK
jgi:small subunit ribosomal protein S16